MSCVSKTLINGCLTTLPPHFTNTSKTLSYQNPFLSTSLKPIKLNLSCSYSSSSFSLPSFLSLKKTNPRYPTVVSVYAAQEQEEEGFVEESAVEEGDEAEEVEEEEYQEPNEDAKLYVGNLPYDVDSESLAQLFGQAGVVEISEVIYDRQTDRSRGFGFVTMSTVEEAEKAAELYNRYDLNGRLLTVNKAARKGSQPERPPRTFEPSFKIYVGNISWDVDDARLEQIFSEHGKVVSARVISDRDTGRSRGFGFVTMASEAEMSDAIANLDGQTLDGRTIRVNAAEERPRRNTF